MYVRHEAIKVCPSDGRSPVPLRTDPFAQLVREVAADLANPFNIERFLWVLEEPPARPCRCCGALFNPWADYAGAPARGVPRRYCSPPCARRAAHARRHARTTTSAHQQWGSAA